MAKLILIRHGQSVWNLKNVFTGWTNVELSENGVEEAKRAGQALKNANISFDVAFTSLLKRAVHTFNIVAQTCDLDWVELHKTWRLNERHYGALQGLNKAEVAAKHGEEQVHIWRRSYDVRPPLLSDSDKRNPKFDPMYGHLDTSCLPLGESLKDCIARTMPYWYDMIAPNLINGKNCIILDDMIDTAGTITNAAAAIKDLGAKDVFACATHPVLSGPAVERLDKSVISEVVLLNTIPIPEEKRIDKMKFLSVAPIFAEAMTRVFTNGSISKLFD